MYQKKKRRNKIMLITTLIVGLLLILLSVLLNKDDRKLGLVEGYIKDSLLLINKVAVYPFNKLKSSECAYGVSEDIYEKELENEIDELRDILEINNLLGESVKTNATIINRNLGYWYDTITIDKGTDDNIELGEAVVVKNGLIGQVIEVSKKNSVVRLLTSSLNNKISVKVEAGDDYAYGLLTAYDEKKNTYLIEGISQTIKINDNALVTTTGLGDSFPSGILIGSVSNIMTDSYDLAKIIEASPSINFDSISMVTILKRGTK